MVNETKKYAGIEALRTFLNSCKNLFAQKTEVDDVQQDIDTYVLNINYSDIEFDTSEIVGE